MHGSLLAHGKHWRCTRIGSDSYRARTPLNSRWIPILVPGMFSRLHRGTSKGIGAFFVLGMSNDDGVSYPSLFGLVGVLVNHLLKPKARAYRLRMEAMAQSSPTSRLRTKPNVVYEVTQLKAIECKAKKGAPLILSELILETKSGSKQKFGVRPTEFKKACEHLKQMYPGLFQLA